MGGARFHDFQARAAARRHEATMPKCPRQLELRVLMALAALALPACQAAPERPTGVARVAVRPLVAESYVARLTVTVSGGAADPGLPPLVAPLERSGSQWTGRVSGIPAGAQRQFDAIAFDAQGRALFAATALADIEAGVATVVSLSLDNRPPEASQNAFPVIDSITWTPEAPAPSAQVQLHAAAHDPDPGDALTYRWSAACGAFDDPTSPAPRWTAPATPQACSLSLEVADGRGASVGFDLSLTVNVNTGGADVVGSVNSWPIIHTLGGALSVWNGGLDGDLTVTASDPDGDPLSYAWQSDCAGLTFDLASPYGLTAPHVHLPVASAPCVVSVSVWDGVAPRPTTGSLAVTPQVIRLNCQNVVCPSGKACDPVDGACKDQGGCAPACAGKACGPDGCGGTCGACGANQACGASAQCVPTCLPDCIGRICGPDGCGGLCGLCGGGTCSAIGQCVFTCTPSCVGKTCGPDGCGGACGTCAGGSCDAAGQCVVACTPSCAGKACGPDGCGGACGTCASGSCDAAGQCASQPVTVAPAVARGLPLGLPMAVAMDGAGATFVGTTLDRAAPADFQTAPGGPPLLLASQYGNDAFVAGYDADGQIAWARAIGDDDPTALTDQSASGVAVTAAGRLGVIGKLAGAVTFGASTLSSAGGYAYLAGLSAADGAGLWGRGFDLGSNGSLARVAASPLDAGGRLAVCGQANRPATTLVPGAAYGGLQDAVVAVFDGAGARLWSVQLGSPGNESCTALAVDDAGDVFAAGQFDGASLPLPGGTALAGPGTTARKFLWVVKFAGGTGAVLASAAFSGPAGGILPLAAAAGLAGELFLAGSFSGAPAFGAATLTSGGSDDGFVVKLDRATLAPAAPPVRLGGSGPDALRGLAVTAAGDVVVTGAVSPSSQAFRAANGGADTTGLAALTVSGATAPDQLVALLSGATLATQDARLYGDASVQSGDAVAACRSAATRPDRVTFAGTSAGTVSYGAAGAVTATGGGALDVTLVFGRLQ